MSSQMIDDHKRTFLPAAGRDLFLPLYDPIVMLMGGNRSRRDLIEQANIKSGQRILDIGCGTGTFAVLLKRLSPNVEVIGLDPDPKALRRAKTKATRAGVLVQFDQGFSDELPYESNSFDRVFSSLMFHHLEEQTRERTLTEVVRVLRPGGSLHLLDFVSADRGLPNSRSHGSHGLHDHVMQLFHSKDRVEGNSDAAILEIMRRAGFTNAERIKNGNMLFGLLRTAYYRGAAD